MAPEILVLVGTLVGAIIGAAGASIPAYLAARAETARHRQRLAFQAGLDEWKRVLDNADRQAKAWPGRHIEVAPAYSYVLFYSRVIDLLDQRQLTADAIKPLLQEMNDLFPDPPST